MTDLNNKQAFWAEQLPAFKENYICLAQLDAVVFNNETGNFDALDKDATGFDREDILEAYHSVNTGWAMWLRAISQEKAKAQAVPEGYVVVPKVPSQEMIQAGLEKVRESWDENPPDGFNSFMWGDMIEVWKDMVEASESGAEG